MPGLARLDPDLVAAEIDTQAPKSPSHGLTPSLANRREVGGCGLIRCFAARQSRPITDVVGTNHPDAASDRGLSLPARLVLHW